MIHALVDDCPYMVVRKGIYDTFSAPLEADQFCLLENFQLMGYGRYRHAQGGGYVAHAHRFLKEHIEYLYSGAVAEYLEQLCQVVQFFLCRHNAFCSCDYILVHLHFVAAGYIVHITTSFHLNNCSNVLYDFFCCLSIGLMKIFFFPFSHKKDRAESAALSEKLFCFFVLADWFCSGNMFAPISSTFCRQQTIV